METSTLKSNLSFLQGGGEMGELTRNFNWKNSSIGRPEEWPQSLRSSLSIIFNSSFPMCLWWGPELFQFYNNAYRAILDPSAPQPTALGQKPEDFSPQLWRTIQPSIEQVLAGGEAVSSEDVYLPINRNGNTKDAYWTFSYSPIIDEDGKVGGVLAVCKETTDKVKNLQDLQVSDNRFQNLVREATVGIIVLRGEEMVVEIVNEAYGQLIDRSADELMGKPLFSIIPEIRKAFYPILNKVRLTGEPVYLYDHPYFVVKNGKRKEGYLNLVYQPYREVGEAIAGVMVLCHDVTEQVLYRKRVEESEHQLRSVVESAPFPIGVYIGKEKRIQLANQSMIRTYGKGDDVIGKLYTEILPELNNQEIFSQIDQVFATGEPFHAKNERVDIVVDGRLQSFYFNYSFTPLFDAQGEVYGVMNTGADVTDVNVAHLKVEESERNFRNLVIKAPVGICIVKGEPAYVELVNDMFLEVVGKQREQFENAPYWVVLKEAAAFYEPILKEVFTTGVTYTGNEHRVLLIRKGVEEIVYINFVYEPVKDHDGNVIKVMIVALDVTAQVIARKKIEEAEERARLAVESAGLGSYEINLLTNEVIASPRMNAIFDVEQSVDRSRYVTAIYPDDLKVRDNAYEEAYKTGLLDYEGRIQRKNGNVNWIRVKGTVYYDKEKKPVQLLGVVQDITEQKQFSDELAKQVKARTIELESKNRELERSNSNLEDFAHAASHDLKEPIRKILFFTDRLKKQLVDRLNDEEKHTFNRIDNATKRMGMLVDDLLLYSHVSEVPPEFEEIDLNNKISKVMDDLELDILEKKATISVGKLPVVKGYRRQLQQLFQNLISNAIKYSKPNVDPKIDITSSIVTAREIGTGISQDNLEKKYYLIQVKDNGIGFEQTYAERIFKIFQRLHGKDEYPGTGVGLSIARKVVENHYGDIVAEGEPGEGATFRIYLPVE